MHPEFYLANGHRFHPHQFRSAGFDALQYSEKSQEAVRSSVSPSFKYLQDNSTIIVPPVGAPAASSGIEVYGAPWQPEFNNWAFNLPPGPELKAKWDMIPDTTDVLITHGPPYMVLDRLLEGDLTGCQQLRDAVARVKPRLHIFGHIHEGYGKYTCLKAKRLCRNAFHSYSRVAPSSPVYLPTKLTPSGTYFDGTTTFVNACTCTRDYVPSNPPIVIDLPLDPTLPARVVHVGEKEEL